MFNRFRNNLSIIILVLIFAGIVGGFINPQYSKALTVAPLLELNGDPGSTIRTQIKVVNEQRETKTYYLRYENFISQDESGSPMFLPRMEDLAIWIHTPESITLGPGESYSFPTEIDIPRNADPGGHFAAIFFLSEPPTTDVQPEVAINTKLGSLILLRVNGDFAQGGDILEFATTNKQHFFSTLPVQFYYRFQNIGDDHQRPVGDIEIKNIFGWGTKTLEANPMQGSVLPKSIRRFTSAWTEARGSFRQAPVIDLPKADKMGFWDAATYQLHNFVIGRYTATVKVGFGYQQFKSDHASFTFYVIPWQLLCVIIPLLIIALLILRLLIKRYNRYIISRAQRS